MASSLIEIATAVPHFLGSPRKLQWPFFALRGLWRRFLALLLLVPLIEQEKQFTQACDVLRVQLGGGFGFLLGGRNAGAGRDGVRGMDVTTRDRAAPFRGLR